ncbi:MAG TPA: hypothetical protein VF733_00985 [Candidatus Saccharimonadales bacterium]
MIKDIQINTDAFERLGWQPRVDEALLGEFMLAQTTGIVVPAEKYLTLQVEPHPNQNDRKWGKGVFHKDGCYTKSRAHVLAYLRPDKDESNGTLLHETRHWVQDVTNMFPRNRTTKGRFIEVFKGLRYVPGMIGCSAVGAMATAYTVYEMTNNALLALVAGEAMGVPGLIISGYESLAHHTPWERDAYMVEKDPMIRERFGNIISYQQI